jgi:serine/threonine-protein kinase HipA
VWLHGSRVGVISTSSPTAIRFQYDEAVLEEYPLNTPVLSGSLPTGLGRTDGRAFFAGLLPEGDHRRALASRAQVLDTDVFALLRAYGQDVAGAVVVGDQVAHRPHASAEPYTKETLDAEVAGLSDRARPLAVYDDSELSIAGLQDKMLLVALPDGRWARPVGGYPSTHILKIDDRAHHGLVVAEHTCLQVARAAEIPAAQTQLTKFGDVDALLVRRFDRVSASASLPERIHQEDSCQALGVDLEGSQGRAKYEAQGGPTLRRVANVLAAWGGPDERFRLLDQVVFTVLTGNADAHGKNISFLHDRPGVIRLAPLYDSVPTALWANLPTRPAMSIGAAIDLAQIDLADIVREASAWGLSETSVLTQATELVERVHHACSLIDRPDEVIAERTVQLITRICERLLTEKRM